MDRGGSMFDGFDLFDQLALFLRKKMHPRFSKLKAVE